MSLDELDAPFVNKQRSSQLASNREAHKRRMERRQQRAHTVAPQQQWLGPEAAVDSGEAGRRPAWLLLDDQHGTRRRAESERDNAPSPRSRLLSLLSALPRVGLGYFLWKVPLGEDDYFSLLRWTLQVNGLHRCNRLDSADCVLYWAISCPPPPVRLSLRHPRCRILHFPHVQQVTHKDWLTYNISTQRDQAGNQRLYPHMPAAFALPEQLHHWLRAHRTLGGEVAQQLHSRLQSVHDEWTRKGRAGKRKGQSDYQQHIKHSAENSRRFHSCHNARPNDDEDELDVHTPIWIVKPAHLGSGRGILLTDLLHHSNAAMQALVDCVREGGVAHRYIERPFLLDGHKWDVRLYALLLPRCTPNLPPADTSLCSQRWRGFPFAVFVFEDGLIRLASQPYPRCADSMIDSLHSPLVHLTNNSINTAGNGGVASNRSFLHFMRSLRASADESSRLLAERIEQQVAECVLSTVSSSSSYLSDGETAEYSRHFDLLGFDALLDARTRLWLCEVNSMPDLQCASSAFSPVHAVDFECKRRLLSATCNLLGLTYAHTDTHTDSTRATATEGALHIATDTSSTGSLPLGGFRRLV